MSKGVAILAGFLGAAVVSAAVPDKDTSAWWGHIKILASNDFQGRLTGSAGYRKAAEYVAKTFAQDGLKPAGTDGFFQSVGFEAQAIDVASSKVSLKQSGGQSVDVSDDVVLSPSVLQRADTRAPLVFVGYGIHLPEAGYDDFAGIDVRGAVVVYLVGGPEQLSGPQRAHATAEALPHYLEQAGALGFLSLTAPKNREVPWERQKAAGLQLGMVLSEKALRRYQGVVFAGAFDEAKADALFEGSGHRFSDLVALADAHKPLPHFRAAVTLDAHVDAKVTHVTSNNIVGEVRGSDTAVSQEAIVLSAHLDHLGTGKPDHGDGIFHGAMDNGSGVATVLEVARMLHAGGPKPRRSIIFLVVCGEEKGLLGSRYFAAHPSAHAGHIVADINTDMFLPLYPLKRVVGFGTDESSLGEDVRVVGAESGVMLVPDPHPDHLSFVRSDQYSFVRKGTPAVALHMSPAPGTAEETQQQDWFLQRYHAQADDLSQPVDLAAADAYTRMLYRLAVRVANAQTAPVWKPESFFARFAQHPLQ